MSGATQSAVNLAATDPKLLDVSKTKETIMAEFNAKVEEQLATARTPLEVSRDAKVKTLSGQSETAVSDATRPFATQLKGLNTSATDITGALTGLTDFEAVMKKGKMIELFDHRVKDKKVPVKFDGDDLKAVHKVETAFEVLRTLDSNFVAELTKRNVTTVPLKLVDANGMVTADGAKAVEAFQATQNTQDAKKKPDSQYFTETQRRLKETLTAHGEVTKNKIELAEAGKEKAELKAKGPFDVQIAEAKSDFNTRLNDEKAKITNQLLSGNVSDSIADKKSANETINTVVGEREKASKAATTAVTANNYDNSFENVRAFVTLPKDAAKMDGFWDKIGRAGMTPDERAQKVPPAADVTLEPAEKEALLRGAAIVKARVMAQDAAKEKTADQKVRIDKALIDKAYGELSKKELRDVIIETDTNLRTIADYNHLNGKAIFSEFGGEGHRGSNKPTKEAELFRKILDKPDGWLKERVLKPYASGSSENVVRGEMPAVEKEEPLTHAGRVVVEAVVDSSKATAKGSRFIGAKVLDWFTDKNGRTAAASGPAAPPSQGPVTHTAKNLPLASDGSPTDLSGKAGGLDQTEAAFKAFQKNLGDKVIVRLSDDKKAILIAKADRDPAHPEQGVLQAFSIDPNSTRSVKQANFNMNDPKFAAAALEKIFPAPAPLFTATIPGVNGEAVEIKGTAKELAQTQAAFQTFVKNLGKEATAYLDRNEIKVKNSAGTIFSVGLVFDPNNSEYVKALNKNMNSNKVAANALNDIKAAAPTPDTPVVAADNTAGAGVDAQQEAAPLAAQQGATRLASQQEATRAAAAELTTLNELLQNGLKGKGYDVSTDQGKVFYVDSKTGLDIEVGLKGNTFAEKKAFIETFVKEMPTAVTEVEVENYLKNALTAKNASFSVSNGKYISDITGIDNEIKLEGKTPAERLEDAKKKFPSEVK